MDYDDYMVAHCCCQAAKKALYDWITTVQRSKDRGQTWETRPLPIEPNTPIWTFAMHAADPNQVFCCSHYGQVFLSPDGGDSWSKIRREFSEIRALTWVPNN